MPQQFLVGALLAAPWAGQALPLHFRIVGDSRVRRDDHPGRMQYAPTPLALVISNDYQLHIDVDVIAQHIITKKVIFILKEGGP